MQSSLGLAGDLDDVELIQDVEAAFGVRFDDGDLRQCRTVGDIFELVSATLPDAGKSQNGCATAMCFYRMRRALQPRLGRELRPATPIEQLSLLPVRELYRCLKHECGFRTPAAVISVWGCIALLLVPTLPLAAVTAGLPWWIAPATAVPAIALFRIAPIRLPGNVATFGDLVRVVAARNIRALSHQGARLRAPEAWTALKDVVSEHTALPKDVIAPDTLLLAPSKAG